MARGNDPSKGFDQQWNESRRRGQDKAQRGEGSWAEDKYLERLNAKPKPAHHAKDGDSCLIPGVALLSGLAWAVAETVQRII